ncbi:MAG: CBS domain-containing protein, partial [Candidatus Thiodiazotropha sp.]
MTAEVETVSPDTSVDQVLSTMELRHISCLVAVDQQRRPIGIFTEQDAIRLMAEKKPIHNLTMGEVMSRSPMTAEESMDFHDA